MMSNSKYFVVLFAVVLVLLTYMNQMVTAKVYVVGGTDQGWKEPDEKLGDAFYNDWAAKEMFHVNDTLLFKYKHDSVLVVDKWGYYHCNTGKPMSTFKDGNTRYNLTKPGQVFFISGDKSHCEEGQRLAIDVPGLHPSPPKKKNAGEKSASVKFVAISLALVATSVALVF